MRLVDVVSAPWAITPDMFAEVQGIYARHMRGEKIDISTIEARIGGGPVANARRDLQIENGVAVIALDGVLAKRMNLFMQISGGSSTQIVGNQVQAALADPRVRAIVLHIDSPGGTVDGTQELARVIAAGGAEKPIIAVADGLMASAAYWIGSAAQAIYITDDTAVVGSIGVVTTHTDWSKWEQMRGIKSTEITAGKYKRIASDLEPLTAEGRATLQAHVDALYKIFVDDVARHRGTDVDSVLSNMADGRLFIGQQAIAAGLVDGVATVDNVIARAAAGEFAPAKKSTAVGGVPSQTVQPQPPEKLMTLTVEKVKQEHPDVASALRAEGHKAGREEGLKAGQAEGLVEGATKERDRIKGVLGQALPGHEALVNTLAFDGKTTAGEAAIAILNADREKRGAKAGELRDDAKEAKVKAAPAPAEGEKDKKKEPEANPHEIAARAQTYIREQAKLGITVSAAQAVAHVTQKKEG